MNLNTEHFSRCIETLEASLAHLKKSQQSHIEYEVFRNATIKGFELTIEIAAKLLKKSLKQFNANPSAIEQLTFKDIIRQAHQHQLLTRDEVQRWFKYRDNRNNTAHDYGVAFAEETLGLLPLFLIDCKKLEKKIQTLSKNK